MIIVLRAFVLVTLTAFLIHTCKQNIKLRDTLQEKDKHILALSQDNATYKERVEAEERRSADQEAYMHKLDTKLHDTFLALSSQSLQQNNTIFLDLAKTTFEKFHSAVEHKEEGIKALLDPLSHSLHTLSLRVQDIEKARIGAYESLSKQVESLVSTQHILHKETASLSKALHMPSAKGRWGEVQLQRLLELSGMHKYVDFHQQKTVISVDNHNALRPDVIIRLPGKKFIIIDAKAPLFKEGDTAAKEHMKHLKKHIASLGEKDYTAHIPSTPQFVVLFLPSDFLLHVLLEEETTILEYAMQHNVILATPATLLALLKVVAHAWQQEALSEESVALFHHIKKLFSQLHAFSEKLNKTEAYIQKTLSHFSDTRHHYEKRILGTAQNFSSLNVLKPEKAEP